MTHFGQARKCDVIRHRTYQRTAECLWPAAAWVSGEGPWAVLAHCRTLTVTLHADLEGAEKAKQTIDDTACGGRCYHRHEIVLIDR